MRATSYTMPGWGFAVHKMEDGTYSVKGDRVSAGKAPTEIITISSGHATIDEATTALITWLAMAGKSGVGRK